MIVFYFTKVSDSYPTYFLGKLFTAEKNIINGFHKEGTMQIVQLVLNESKVKNIDLKKLDVDTSQNNQVFLIDDSLDVDTHGFIKNKEEVMKNEENIIDVFLSAISEESEVCIYYHRTSFDRHKIFSDLVEKRNPKKIWQIAKDGNNGFSHLDPKQQNPFINISQFLEKENEEEIEKFILDQKELWFGADYSLLNLKLEFLHKCLGYIYDGELFAKISPFTRITLDDTDIVLIENQEGGNERIEYLKKLRDELLKDEV